MRVIEHSRLTWWRKANAASIAAGGPEMPLGAAQAALDAGQAAEAAGSAYAATQRAQRRPWRMTPSAPAKPPLGAPCNGCGRCCQEELCHIGEMAFGDDMEAPCPALVHDAVRARQDTGAWA